MAWLETLTEGAEYVKRAAEGVAYTVSGDPSMVDDTDAARIREELARRQAATPQAPGWSLAGLGPVVMVGGLIVLIAVLMRR